MKDNLEYIKLRAHLYEREVQNTVSFKLQELESIWFCSLKNCKRILKKYEQLGYYSYLPGIGRGNSSYLTFKNSFQKEVENIIQAHIEKEELDAIFQLMELPIPKSWFSAFRFNIEQLFGFHKGTKNIDTLRTALKRNIITLNPRIASVTFECSLIRQLGDTLVSYDRETDTVRPHLAHHWTVNEEYTVWKFYLRKGILFHNQRIMTSHDILHTFQQFQDIACPFYWLVEDIKSIECPTDYTIIFTLNRPNTFFLRMISSENLAILPRDIPFDEKTWIGTGPFMLKEWSDKKVILEANNHYFKERPLIDEIEFYRVPLETFQQETYELNTAQGTNKLINKEIIEPGFRFLIFNFKKQSIVHNPSFREAIYHILDLKKMWRELGRENLTEASSYFPWKSKPQIKNPEKIASLLKRSGYKGETLTIMAPYGRRAPEEMDWFIKELNKHSIQIEAHFFEMENYYSLDLEEKADLVFMGEISSIDPPLSFMGAFKNQALLFRRFWPNNHLQYIDELLEHFKNKNDSAARDEIIDRIDAYIKEQHLLVFTIHPLRNRVFHSMIQDIQFESYGYVDFRKLWVE